MNSIIIEQVKDKRKSVRIALNRYFMLMVAIILAMNFTACSKFCKSEKNYYLCNS